MHAQPGAERDAAFISRLAARERRSGRRFAIEIDTLANVVASDASAREVMRLAGGKGLRRGHSVLDALPEGSNTRRRAQHAWQQVLGGRSFEVTVELPWADRVFACLYRPVRNSSDEVVGARCDALDVTETYDPWGASTALSAAVARLTDMVLITDAENIDAPDGPRIAFVNDAFLLRTGYHRQEVIGRTPRMLQGIGTNRETLQAVREALQAREPIRVELLNYTKSGEPFWLEMEIAPVLDASGWCTHFVAVQRDVSERKQQAHMITESEHRLSSALAASGSALWSWDLHDNRAYYDGVWTALVGTYDQAPSVSSRRTWLDHIHPDDAAHVAFHIDAHIDGRLPMIEVEHRVRTASGEWRWMMARGRVTEWGEDGAPRLLSGTITDVSLAKLLEDERVLLLAEAERSRAELDISNEQLRRQASLLERRAAELQVMSAALEGSVVKERHARAEAEFERAAAQEANKGKSEFLAAMSHELRTPLNAIQGYGQLMAMEVYGAITDQQRQALSRIDLSQRNLLALINDILNFAKIESGRLDFNIRPLNLAELVERSVGLMESQLSSKGLNLVQQSCTEAIMVRADADRTQQILLNLLTNAVKFTDERNGAPGTVRVACVVNEPDRPGAPTTVSVRVHDSGRGIPPEMIDSIFDPFVQVDRYRTTGSQQGVGLGLAISRELARAMNGDLHVSSVLGEGSTFTLTLPTA